MLDVDALGRLRNEVLLKRCEVERLLAWYAPLDHACRAMGYLTCFIYYDDPITSDDESVDELMWLCSLSKHRRKTIKARKKPLEAWQGDLNFVYYHVSDYTKELQAWSVVASLLSFHLRGEDVIKLIWNYVLEDTSPYDRRDWYIRMTHTIPLFPIEPPCSYERRKKFWLVRCMWKQLIREKCKQHADVGKIPEVHYYWEKVFEPSYALWVQTYRPFRLA